MANRDNSSRSEQIRWLDKIFAASTDHVSVCDREGRYLYINPAELAIFGLQFSDVIGKTGRELDFAAHILERDGIELEAQRESVFQTGIPVRGETSFSTIQGIRYYEYVISPVIEPATEPATESATESTAELDKAIAAVTQISRDITERKQAEAALRSLNEELEASAIARTEEIATLNQSLASEVAEYQKIAQALQESEMRFHALANAMFEGIVVQENGRIIDANPGFARMFGYVLEEVIGKAAPDFLTPESLEILLHHTQNRDEQPYEMTGIRKDGSLIYLEVVGKQSLYQGRSVRVSAARDITDRKQAQLHEQFLNELDLRLRQHSSAEAMVQEAVSRLGSYLNVDRCLWYQVDLDAGIAIVEQDWRRSEVPSMVGTYRLSEFILPELVDLFQAGQPAVIPDVWHSVYTAPFAENFLSLHIRAFVAVPCLYEGRWVSTLSLNSQTVRSWRADEVVLLQAMVGRLWSTIEQVRAVQALKAQEERTRLATEAANLGMWFWNVPQNELIWTDRCRVLFGVAPDVPISYDMFLNTLHPDDRELTHTAVMQALEQKSDYSIECRAVWADGSIRWIAGKGRAFYDASGQPIQMMGTAQDITEQKNAEAKLRQRERLFSTLTQALPVTVFRFDANNNCIYVNDYWTAMSGRTAESAMGVNWVESLHPEDRDRLLREWLEWNQDAAQRGLYQNEGRLVHLHGRDIWYSIQALPEMNANGEIVGYVGVMTDITDRKLAEQALQEREAVLRLFAQYAPAGIAMFDREMRYLMASQRWADDYHLGSLELLIGRSHYELFPEIPERWRQIHQRCLAGAIETCDEDLFLRADGAEQWIRWEVRPWYTAREQIDGLIVFAEDITRRKQAEASIFQLNQELQRRVAELQTLLEVIPIGIGIAEDPECRTIRVNPALAEALGIPPTVNASLSAPEEERPTSFKVYQNGRELAPEELPLQYAAAHGVEIRDLEVEVIWQDGTTVTLLEYAAPLLNESGLPRGSVGAFLDITDRKRAEQFMRTARDELERQVQARTQELQEAYAMLQQREREFRTLVENTPDVITRHDRQYRCLYINPASTQTLGLPPEFFFGKTPAELGYPEDLVRFWQDSLESVFTSGEMRIDEFTAMNGDEARSYQVYVVPERDADTAVTSVMTIGRDITSLRQAEQSTRKLAEELQRSNQELEQFAYVASHDLQEPLRAIASFTQLLAKQYQGKLDGKANMYIEFIVDGATRMQQLIRDLLAYSRASRYDLKRQSVDCNALLERVKKDLQVAIAENRAVITADPLPTITADANQIAILLQNLIGNSLKYRTEADPRIHISAAIVPLVENHADPDSPSPAITPARTTPETEWLFSIRDNGIGIEPQYAERIFGIFQRLHASDEYSGTGLGLAICRKIVERHEGRIWVESQLGQGATFCFTIPISTRI